MRSSREVLGNPGDDQSGMVFRAVVHFMEAASMEAASKSWRLQVTSGSLSGSKYRSHTGKNKSRQAQTICPCSGWSRDVGSSIHQPPDALTVTWLSG